MNETPTPSYDLTILLALAFRSLIDELHAHLASLGYDDVRPSHGFAFQRISHGDATGNDIAAFLGITKQAASELIDYLEAHNYITRQPNPTDKRGKIITLTPRGWNCIRETEAFLTRFEQQFAATIGKDRMSALRSDLHTLVLSANKGHMPTKLRPVW
ncbi:MAG: MarR family winged helix-turn-helix transcriptional regulator [Chloroflexia bacterium]